MLLTAPDLDHYRDIQALLTDIVHPMDLRLDLLPITMPIRRWEEVHP